MFALIARGYVQAITQTGYVQGKMCTGQTHQAGRVWGITNKKVHIKPN